MPAAWCAHKQPRRPPPVITSSAMKSTPCFWRPRKTLFKSSGVCMRMPPAPCTSGSIMTAATSSYRQVIVQCSASKGKMSAWQIAARTDQRKGIAAHRHRSERVAMVAVLETDEPRAPRLPVVAPKLIGHLKGNFDGGAAIVGVKDTAATPCHRAKEQLGESIPGDASCPRNAHGHNERQPPRKASIKGGWRWPCRIVHHDEMPSMSRRPSAK